MQQVGLWEITADRKLPEIPARYDSLEEWIVDCLADDISVLDPNLLVIGRQVRTSFGGAVGPDEIRTFRARRVEARRFFFA